MFVFVAAEYETPQNSLNQVSPVDGYTKLIPIPMGALLVFVFVAADTIISYY